MEGQGPDMRGQEPPKPEQGFQHKGHNQNAQGNFQKTRK